MQGKLFTQDFLREGIKETDAWKCLDSNELTRFRKCIGTIFDAFPADSQANEAVTETEIVFKVLEALGWASLPQQTASGKGRQDVPDVLLFADAAAKQAALAERKDEQRYRHGAAIVECKRWRRPLDRGDRTDPLDAIGNQTIADFIREQVLRLTYTAVDMRPFAADMGYGGEPFIWDEDDRRHRLARLDALFFHLYGLDRNDADYILAQFPIVREQDEKQFGRYLTRDLILAYMNAVAAGDLETAVEVR